jgi:hypothetical protein
MATTQGARHPTFRVLDAMDAPHGGRIVRLRLQSGEPPKIGALKGARLKATSTDGRSSTTLKVLGFAVFGGKPTDERLARTGRIDLHVDEEGGPPVGLRWEIRPE